MSVELVTFIAQQLVAEPEALSVQARQDGRDTKIEIRCAPDDAGRIIGRGGRVINSIRTLARAQADGRNFIEVQLLD